MSNSFKTLNKLNVNGQDYEFYDLSRLSHLTDLARLPFSIKILLENLLRLEDGVNVTAKDIQNLLDWSPAKSLDQEIAFSPSRVLLQDFTGVPVVVDMAAMRSAMAELGGSAKSINPLTPVELVIDHSVMVDFYGNKKSLHQNAELEFNRNEERYAFLKWGQEALDNFKVVPPDTGIVHQVNLEYLARVVFFNEKTNTLYPDTLVGTDSHTTMINGLGVLGWGVGGIEAEAAMLGQPVTMLVPEVVGFQITGKMPEGTTATDLVLTITEQLRKFKVVGKFVEFYGDGLDNLPLADRATIANMAPEYGATCGIFPIDEETLNFLRLSGREEVQIARVAAYAKKQGMFRTTGMAEPSYANKLSLDLGSIVPSIAGPKRPQDRIALNVAKLAFQNVLQEQANPNARVSVSDQGQSFELSHGSVVIAAITSCTNTSNPDVMVAAGLLAKKAHALGLRIKPWVKSSLAPGSQVVTDYLDKAELSAPLDALGFATVGYGCTTCIGNSGPLAAPISQAIKDHKLSVSAVLSGNRNFEGRIHQDVRNAYLASPPLVVAYALAGTTNFDFASESLGRSLDNQEVFLKDIWPSREEVQSTVRRVLKGEMYTKRYSDVFLGDARWQGIKVDGNELYQWSDQSSYIKHPPYFDQMSLSPKPLKNIQQARLLALLGDSVTTDHISPAGDIAVKSPAGDYLKSLGVNQADFNSYGARRGNHEVMVRGTFANTRLKNKLLHNVEGGMTMYYPNNQQMTIFEASKLYQASNTPLIIIAGKEYGTGSSRDWAAKGTLLLGVKAVIAESFERIHRSNLVGMGVLPLEFSAGESASSLQIEGHCEFNLQIDHLSPRQELKVEILKDQKVCQSFMVQVRIDTPKELEYFEHGGILPYVLRQLKNKS